jgi:hypothetical protein
MDAFAHGHSRLEAWARGAPPDPEVWTRAQAIGNLRRGLLALCDGEHSMCEVAADQGIFCRGFRRWHDAEFHRRWKPALGRSTHLSRPQIERLANVWQLAEQVRCRVPLACDVQTDLRGPCRGWNEFSDETLARYCWEILGRNVIVGNPPPRA